MMDMQQLIDSVGNTLGTPETATPLIRDAIMDADRRITESICGLPEGSLGWLSPVDYFDWPEFTNDLDFFDAHTEISE